MPTHDRRGVLRSIGAGTVGLVTGGTATVGAGDDEDDAPARLRVAHASPDAPNVDVLANHDPILTDVAFGTVTDYLSVPPGDYTVTITAAGDRDTVAFEGELSVEAGTAYTVAAIGELSEETFRPLVLVDDDRRPLPGIAYLRAVHASPDAPDVDVTLSDGGFALFADVAFGDATAYRAVPAREFTVGIRPASGGDPVAEVDVDLASETAYTAFAEGYLTPDDEPGDASLRLLPVVDGRDRPTPTGRVRVAHASPDAPDVDVFLDGQKVLSAVPFRAVSDYLEVSAGTVTITITPAGHPDTRLFSGHVTVRADSDYTAVALGEASEETFRPVVFRDDNGVERGRARLRLVHASPDAPAVDVTAGGAETTLVDGLSFGRASDYLTLHPGSTAVAVRPDSRSDDNPFDAEFDLGLRPGRVYTAFAEGYFTTDDEPVHERFGLVTSVDASAH